MSFSAQRVIGLLVSHFGTLAELNAAIREEKKLFNRFKMLLEEVTEGAICETNSEDEFDYDERHGH